MVRFLTVQIIAFGILVGFFAVQECRADTDSDARALMFMQLALANQPAAKSIDDLPPLKFTLPKPEPKAPLTVPADNHFHYAGCCGVYFAHDGKAGSSHACPRCGRGNWTTIVRAPAPGTTVYLNPARVKRAVDNCPE